MATITFATCASRGEPRKMTIREAVENMENSDIYLDRADRGGFFVRFTDLLHFETGEAELSEDSRELLRRFANVLKDYDNSTVVRGHASTPNISTLEYQSNEELSEVRAQTVANNLIHEHGISGRRISTKAYGESQPYVEEIDAEDEALNRRVDFFIKD